jgi:hypothetical protein
MHLTNVIGAFLLLLTTWVNFVVQVALVIFISSAIEDYFFNEDRLGKFAVYSLKSSAFEIHGIHGIRNSRHSKFIALLFVGGELDLGGLVGADGSGDASDWPQERGHWRRLETWEKLCWTRHRYFPSAI